MVERSAFRNLRSWGFAPTKSDSSFAHTDSSFALTNSSFTHTGPSYVYDNSSSGRQLIRPVHSSFGDSVHRGGG